MTPATPEFVAPGPGFWNIDRSHYPGGTTPISEWLISESMLAGFQRVFAESGIPADGLDAKFVNGFMYNRLRPLLGPDKPPNKLPPAIVLKIATRVHPAFRARNKQVQITLVERTSIAVAEQWETEIRPRVMTANLEFQDVDVDSVSDEALERHIADLLAHLREHFELHFWLHGHDLGPVARFLYFSIEAGLDPGDVIEALGGASPTTAVPVGILARLRTMVDESGTEVASLDGVRAVSAEASTLLDDYLSEHGNVLATGYDITAFTLNELPGVILNSIRTAKPPVPVDHHALAAALRNQLQPEQRPEFDGLLSDARSVMDMRDDNGPLVVEWPAGLLRRALLAAGKRLSDRGALDEADHALELTPDEAKTALSRQLPSAAQIAERADRRMRLALISPPETLGEPEPEPPLDVMPAPLAEAVATVQVAIEHMGMNAARKTDPMSGAGIGTTSYVGRARTAASADDAIETLEPGDVLVVRATSPAFNAVLSIAGAVVTANGGLLSHAAVLARELRIPAVVGAPGALDIPDGATVEVDPVAGVVQVLGSADAE